MNDEMENVGVARVKSSVEDDEHELGTKDKKGKDKSQDEVDSDSSDAKKKSESDGKTDDAQKQKDEKKKKSDAIKEEEEAQKEEDAKKNKKNKNSAKDKLKKASAIGNVAGKVGLLAKILGAFQMLMGLVSTVATAVTSAVSGVIGFFANIINAIVNGVTSFVSAVGSFFSGLVSAIASFFGIGSTAATVAAGAVIGGISVSAVAAIAVVNMSITFNANRDGQLVDCSTDVETALTAVSDEMSNDEQLVYNAQSVYSIFAYLGYSDEQIAGILGNWTAESSIDPTSIEGIYDEKYNILGEKHQAAMTDWDAYVRGDLSDKYRNSSASGGPINNPSGYTATDGLMYPGIGMGQYTGNNAYKLLSVALDTGYAWYSLEFQVAYTLAFGSPTGRSGFWDTYAEQTGTPSELAEYFSQYWEGNTKNGQDERKQWAEEWYNMISNWSVNTTYASSVVNMVSDLNTAATDLNVSTAQWSCVSTITIDNSSAARAAVSYAYETKEEGLDNKGTALYQVVHDAIFPGDTVYMACDRGVACAIRWSGTDDTYPKGNTDEQLLYLRTSDKWELVGTADELTLEDLMPGDVFIVSGHTFIYTGTVAVQAVYPLSDGNSVSASLDERSPGVGTDATDVLANGGTDGVEGRGVYSVYRCVDPDNSSTYTDVAAHLS